MAELTDTTKHFDMGEGYKENSASQISIGQKTIEVFTNIVKADQQATLKTDINVIDLACGPGNLTIELQAVLVETLPGVVVHIAGLDLSPENLNKLQTSSDGKISTIEASFYDEPKDPDQEDYVFSNEGLHWQPPYEMEAIHYSHLKGEERGKYESWALANFEKALGNVYKYLKEDGTAVLQFGHEGQLQALWDLVQGVVDLPQFKKYQALINFPLFYPPQEKIEPILKKVGFKQTELNGFNQDLVEDSPEKITNFFKAFTEPGFARFFKGEDLVDFYRTIEEQLDGMGSEDLENFRKNQWHRTLVVARK